MSLPSRLLGANPSIQVSRLLSGSLSTPSAKLQFELPTFVTTASGGTVAATSKNGGSSWTQRTLPASASWNTLAYGNNIFLAVGNGSTIAATSPDGITWTQRTMPTSSAWMQAVYANATWVVSGQNSPSVLSRSSDNGVTWANVTSGSNGFCGIAYGNSVFVHVETDANAGNLARYSSTAATGSWSSAGTLGAATGWGRVFYGDNGGFIVCNNLSGNYVSQSQTGTGSFTLRTLPYTQAWRTCLAYGNGTWSYLTAGTTQACSSTDGITWTARTAPSTDTWNSMTYDATQGLFVAVASGGTVAATSPTGTGTWTLRTLPTSADWYPVATNG
jgi:hypothetical protein